MPHSRWISRSPMLVAAAFAVAALSACGTSGDPNPAGSSGPTTSSATTTQAPTTQRPEPQVSEAAAQKLCDAIRPELSNFRVQGNLIVHPWGLQNGIDVLNNKTVVDTATSKSCPDVRQQAIEALEVPDLATVVVGL
ncbi:Uncharacterised protein [Mycobacteroides abscessus subsp. abscessus]|nr:Uncharacterised protein [Mycobacteroides abscessus subsp. abscessus]